MNITTKTKFSRQNYMDGNITHQDYYLNLANILGFTKDSLPITYGEFIMMKHDEHLNNIPLIKWDDQHKCIVMAVKQNSIDIHNATYPESFYDGSVSWSMSDSVCTLKAYAKHLLGVA